VTEEVREVTRAVIAASVNLFEESFNSISFGYDIGVLSIQEKKKKKEEKRES
jgi:hypothetical protein